MKIWNASTLLLASCVSAHAQGSFGVSSSDFQEKVIDDSKNQPVVVLLRGNDCEPCAKLFVMTPQAAFAAFAGKVKFYVANIEAERDLATKLKVPTTPSILLFKDGASVATIRAVPDLNMLFHYFAGKAPEEAKQVYKKPPDEFVPKRPPGADLKTIGNWSIQRSGGIASSLGLDTYKLRGTKQQVGRWSVDATASLSLRYSVETRDLIWDVYYVQDIIRDISNERRDYQTGYGFTKSEKHEGVQVLMRVDGQVVAQIPSPSFLITKEAADDARRAPGRVSTQGRYKDGRWFFAIANDYLFRPGGGSWTPKEFEKMFVSAKKVEFFIVVERQQVVIAEADLADTLKAVNYLKAEREYEVRTLSAVKIKR